MYFSGADQGGGKHADDKSVNKATEMLEDISEGGSEESSSEDEIVLAALIEASDCESEQGTAGGACDRITLSIPATNCGLFFRGRGILWFQLSHQTEACKIEI